MIDIILSFIVGIILGIIAGAIAFIYDFIIWIIKEWITIIKLVWYNIGEVYNGHIALLIYSSLKEYYDGTIWKVLIKWEWLCGVVVPYHTTGKIRCERVELLGVVE